MSHRNVCTSALTVEVACCRTKRTLTGCTDLLSSKGVGAPHQCPRVDQKPKRSRHPKSLASCGCPSGEALDHAWVCSQSGQSRRSQSLAGPSPSTQRLGALQVKALAPCSGMQSVRANRFRRNTYITSGIRQIIYIYTLHAVTRKVFRWLLRYFPSTDSLQFFSHQSRRGLGRLDGQN